MSQRKIILQIPKDLKPDQRAELADLVIEHIVQRTQDGLDKNGKKFPKYSDAYVKSLDFKNAGKSRSKVDLQLSGDMLAAIDYLSGAAGKITIGFKNGTDENAKAEGNILGSYGGSPNHKKARDFLGIDQDKLDQLIEHVKNSGD